jgi:hypothetical protein
MDRRLAQDLDRWLTTPPEEPEDDDNPTVDDADDDGDNDPDPWHEDEPEPETDPLDLLYAAIDRGDNVEVYRLVSVVGSMSAARIFREWEEHNGRRIIGMVNPHLKVKEC